MNLLNFLDREIGAYFHTDFTESAFYHYFRYRDLAMLEIMGDMNAYYSYDLNLWDEKFGKSFLLDDEFVSSIKAMVYNDEYQPLLPFNSRQLIKEKLISLGVEKPKYGSTNQSFFLLPQLFHHPHTNMMDKEVIILSGVIVLVVLLFVSANKWQKAEKKLKIAEKKLEEYKQGNSSDSFS